MALRCTALALAAFAAWVGPAQAEGDGAAALAVALNAKIAPCWTVPGDLPAHVAAVKVRLSLTESGELDGSPAIEGSTAGDAASKAFAAGAIRAIVRCAPFAGLSEIAPYATWKTVFVTFNRPEL